MKRTAMLLLAAALLAPSAFCQETGAESVEGLAEEIDLLDLLDAFDLTLEQLERTAPILETAAAKRQAGDDYRVSEAALGPLRALRAALMAGKPSGAHRAAVAEVWNRLVQLEAEHDAALAQAMSEIAALLTDEQLVAATAGAEWSYEEADLVFANLETARAWEAGEFAAFVERTSQEIAFREGGADAADAADLRTRLKAYFEKVRALTGPGFENQYDTLFEELQSIIEDSMPKPTRAVSEARAAEELGYIFMSERALPLVRELAKARAQG